MMTDPIADLLTRIRNGLRNHSGTCTVPGSRLKVAVLEVLKREGYIVGYTIHSEGVKSVVQVDLKYGPEGE
jgi:small subunit ribosomal protein S8